VTFRISLPPVFFRTIVDKLPNTLKYERVPRRPAETLLSTSLLLLEMNPALVEQLGEAVPPAFDADVRFVNTLSVSPKGDVMVLTADGQLKLGSLRTVGASSPLETIEVFGLSREEAATFNFLDFNEDGSALLVWSSTRVGFIDLAIVRGGPCTYNNIWSTSAVEEGASYPIAKASFHPLCNHCVVLLHEQGGLRLVDLRSQNAQVVSVPAGLVFRSFSFGPNIDWLRFSVLLLSSAGDVYALCPVIPTGAVVSVSAVAELWQWADQLSGDNNSEDGIVEEYIVSLYEYLKNVFGSRPVPEDGDALQYVRAGEVTALPWESGDAGSIRTLTNYLPMLTGPLRMQRSADGDVDDEFSSTEGKRDSRDGALKRSGADACDICVPASGRGSAPVVALSFGSGRVEIYLLDSALVRCFRLCFDLLSGNIMLCCVSCDTGEFRRKTQSNTDRAQPVLPRPVLAVDRPCPAGSRLHRCRPSRC
jgi:hypothetical protein